MACESGRPSSLLLTLVPADSAPEASGFASPDVGTSDPFEVCCYARLEPEIADSGFDMPEAIESLLANALPPPFDPDLYD